jgi:hypothetical protein
MVGGGHVFAYSVAWGGAKSHRRLGVGRCGQALAGEGWLRQGQRRPGRGPGPWRDKAVSIPHDAGGAAARRGARAAGHSCPRVPERSAGGAVSRAAAARRRGSGLTAPCNPAPGGLRGRGAPIAREAARRVTRAARPPPHSYQRHSRSSQLIETA